jgi:hypothetical protein
MFGYLLLLFQLFLGGHFHMGYSGMPSEYNEGELFYIRKDLIGVNPEGMMRVPLPEWEWHFGKLVFQGDLNQFFGMSSHKKTDYYLRSGASMWKEGLSSLSILTLQCIVAVYLVKTILDLDNLAGTTVCPVYDDLRTYCRFECFFSIMALIICWVSCVRGVSADKSIWVFFILNGVLDLVWNTWGTIVVFRGGSNLCALSAPVVQQTAQTCVFISMFCTFLIIAAGLRYCLHARYVREEAKTIVLKGLEKDEDDLNKALQEFEEKYKSDDDNSDANDDDGKQHNIKTGREGRGQKKTNSLLDNIPTASPLEVNQLNTRNEIKKTK